MIKIRSTDLKLRISELFKNNKSIIHYGVDRMHESLFLSEMTQEKQTCIRDKQIFPKSLDDYPIRNFCHLWWLLSGEKSSVSLLVLVSVGKRAPKHVLKDDGVQTLVRSHNAHNQTPHRDITHKRELEKANSRV